MTQHTDKGVEMGGTYVVTMREGGAEMIYADDFEVGLAGMFGAQGNLTLTLEGRRVAFYPGHRWAEVRRVEVKPEPPQVAKAALDALLAEPEWVEWVWGNDKQGYVTQRCSRLGEGMEFSAFPHNTNAWHPEPRNSGVPEAYRAGRATGLEDGRKEALELAEATIEFWKDAAVSRPVVRFLALARKVKGE